MPDSGIAGEGQMDYVKIPLMGYDFPPSAPHLLIGSQLQLAGLSPLGGSYKPCTAPFCLRYACVDVPVDPHSTGFTVKHSSTLSGIWPTFRASAACAVCFLPGKLDHGKALRIGWRTWSLSIMCQNAMSYESYDFCAHLCTTYRYRQLNGMRQMDSWSAETDGHRTSTKNWQSRQMKSLIIYGVLVSVMPKGESDPFFI